MLVATLVASISFETERIEADIVISSRLSEISLDSTNFGGVSDLVSSTHLSNPFHEQLSGTVNYAEPGGNINFGLWNASQDTIISPNFMQSTMQSHVITQQVFGLGIGILNISNTFEAEFEVTEVTPIELDGAVFGDTGFLLAEDFVRVQLQQHNGIIFANLFDTFAGDDFSSPYIDTLQPETLYRMVVFSRAKAMGEGESTSGVTAFLRPPILLGDVNRDGVANLLDVNPFVDRLSTGVFQAEADVNEDGVVNLLDVDPFVAILSGG